MLRVAGLRAWRRPVTCMSSGCETTYHTLARATTITEIEVKKSRFLAKASPVATADEAMAFVRGQSDPGASHNCFAYSIGQGDPSEFRSSDDGEPSGTGGRPILAAIGQENLTNVCVLVTRYYGGTKLGTGGLIRAYGGAARTCLQSGERVEVRPRTRMSLRVAFDDIGSVFRVLDAQDPPLLRLREDYLDTHLEVELDLEMAQAESLGATLMQITSGRVGLND